MAKKKTEENLTDLVKDLTKDDTISISLNKFRYLDPLYFLNEVQDSLFKKYTTDRSREDLVKDTLKELSDRGVQLDFNLINIALRIISIELDYFNCINEVLDVMYKDYEQLEGTTSANSKEMLN